MAGGVRVLATLARVCVFVCVCVCTQLSESTRNPVSSLPASPRIRLTNAAVHSCAALPPLPPLSSAFASSLC